VGVCEYGWEEMANLLEILALFFLYVFLVAFLLPKLGVPT